MTLPDVSTLVPAIRTASRRLVRELGFLRSTLAGTDLPPSAVHALIEIDAHGTLSAGALCRVLNLEKSSVSRMVRKLVDAGELAETTDDRDGRARSLCLTAHGRETLRRIDTFAQSQVTAALNRLGSREQVALRDSLAAYAEALADCRTDAPARTRPAILLESGYRHGMIGRCVEMHSSFYRRFGFAASFERIVAEGLAEFVGRIDGPANVFLSAVVDERIVGTIAIDGEHLGAGIAHLRWFILDEACRGGGIGRRLLQEALAFCDRTGFAETQLWTFRGLDAARGLYEENGFVPVQERAGRQWGTEVIEQRFVRAGKTGS